MDLSLIARRDMTSHLIQQAEVSWSSADDKEAIWISLPRPGRLLYALELSDPSWAMLGWQLPLCDRLATSHFAANGSSFRLSFPLFCFLILHLEK